MAHFYIDKNSFLRKSVQRLNVCFVLLNIKIKIKKKSNKNKNANSNLTQDGKAW